jgi:general stress protein 26
MGVKKENSNWYSQEAQGSREELQAFLKEFDTAMFVTVTPEHMVRARPMAIENPTELGDCDLWFVTSDATAKVDEVVHDQQVGVVCFRSRDKAYISISAKARVDKNQELIKRLWKPDWKAWFPNGPDDPSLCLIKLDVEHAEYWEPEGGRARVLVNMVKAFVTKEPAQKGINPPKHV